LNKASGNCNLPVADYQRQVSMKSKKIVMPAELVDASLRDGAAEVGLTRH
jgi:hypothetical protein